MLLAYPLAREGRKKSFALLFPPPILFCSHPNSSSPKHFLYFLSSKSTFFFFSFSASRIDTCRTHAHLSDDIIDSTVESSSRGEGLKGSARIENQILEKEIQELKRKSKDYQGESQPQSFPRKLEKENKGQQQENGQSQRKYKELEDKVTNRTSELKEILAEIIQQHTGE